jgi:rhodanese-related sulfurtransferase
MAPLVPDIISQNLNFIAAFFIGIGFGAILEQAGFSSSRKLVGLFYGYDFTVLRVFFTAGVVAMVGVMGLNHFGLIDMKLVYINPTFLHSAVVGGLIMGLGFVTGGFCPGTSVCAAAIGKIDALIFILGTGLGVLVFAEGYPLFEGLYKAGNMGSPQIFTTLGMSRNLFALLLVLAATGAFFGVEIIEKKVNGKKPLFRLSTHHVGLAGAALVLAVFSLAFTDKKETLLKKAGDMSLVNSYHYDFITADELACRLMSKDPRVQIIDFRKAEDFTRLSFPSSYLFVLENLFEKEPNEVLTIKHKVNVFVAEDELSARKLAMIATEMGYRRIRVLQGGFKGFRKDILSFKPDPAHPGSSEDPEYRFRLRAGQNVPKLMIKDRKSGPPKKTIKRALGGC